MISTTVGAFDNQKLVGNMRFFIYKLGTISFFYKAIKIIYKQKTLFIYESSTVYLDKSLRI